MSAMPMRMTANMRGSSSASRLRRTDSMRVASQASRPSSAAKHSHPTCELSSGGTRV